MTREEAHAVLEECLKHGERINLYGEIRFTVQFERGKIRQIVDEGWKKNTRTKKLTTP